jgi:HEAT repeat protein
VQAITALGVIGDRAATEPLMACMESLNGWIRVSAATALSDLGDPAAAIVLARQMAYAGDPFRKFEVWDYPGTTETTVSPEDWSTVDYYVVDAAAADALLQMGSRGAVGWLLKNDLDPKRRNVRIRVLQDALDVLRRHLPDAPTADYLPDGGLPQRHAAFEKLEAWWRAHRDDPGLLKATFPETDPGFVNAARGLALKLTQPKVLELMIAKDSAEILGACFTPALIAMLAETKSPAAKVELAQALERVRDPRAVAPLLDLLREKAAFLRAAATRSLQPYAWRGEPRVIDPLVAGLASPDCAVNLAAMQALVAAPPSEQVRQALGAHAEADYLRRCGQDANFPLAAAVVRLVQEGADHWPAVKQGLVSPDRVVRRTTWDLLRVALDLYEHLYDPIPPPDRPEWRPIEEAEVLDALRARRKQ